MSTDNIKVRRLPVTRPLEDQFRRTRAQTLLLCEGLNPEDMVAQSMADASPTKWHLAHTTWFFETFILAKFAHNYRLFSTDFPYLFNSYYETQGARHARPQRGLLTRPPIEDVLDYRRHVDRAMSGLLSRQAVSADIEEIVIIGLQHEMQHQELILTDLLHLFSCSPLLPAVQPAPPAPTFGQSRAATMVAFEGGLIEIGAAEQTTSEQTASEQTASEQTASFSYDCERPRHKVWLDAFRLADRPVSNGEWLEFLDAGGYNEPLLWLADGWHQRQEQGWQAPGYWQLKDGQWHQFGLCGLLPLDPGAPVCHISYYEADAYARWRGKRLPTEQEWEHVAQVIAPAPSNSNFMESHQWRPLPAPDDGASVRQLFGDVWEWTQSHFSPYPGFRPEQGALAEYNGKFMANQFVLRGGSCATPTLQVRSSYRNFFYPHQRWQFSGMRLAETAI